MLKHEIQDISENTKPNAVKIKHKVGDVKCTFRMQYDDVITNPRWRTDAILKIVFGDILAHQREIWSRGEGSHADIGHVTTTAIFANSRWRTAAILKIALSPYLSRELSDFDQIW